MTLVLRRLLPLCFLMLFSAVASSTSAAASADGPPYWDPKRGNRVQRSAADDAAKQIAEGAAQIKAAVDFLADPSAQVRDRVLEVISSKWSAEDRQRLVNYLGDSRHLVREGIAEICVRGGEKSAAKFIAKILPKTARRETRLVLIWALAELGDSDSYKLLLKLYKKEKRDPFVRAELLRALDGLDSEQAKKLVEKAWQDKVLATRIAAIDVSYAHDVGAALHKIADQLAKPAKDREGTWGDRVAFAGLDRIRATKGRAAVRDALVVALSACVDRLQEKKVDGRLRSDLVKTLEELTGESFSDSIGWREWWKHAKDKWQPRSQGSPAAKKKTTGVVKFHGMPIDSLRVIFVSDLSGGMSRTLDGQFDGDGMKRVDYARAELKKVLSKLSGRCYVNLVYFASEFFTWGKGPAKLAKARLKLQAYNEKQSIPRKPHSNRGNIYDALIHAEQQSHVDTIYLLTEGAPTEGKYLDYKRLLEHFGRWSRNTRIRVYVLNMGEVRGRNESFMKDLADMTDGEFLELGDPRR